MARGTHKIGTWKHQLETRLLNRKQDLRLKRFYLLINIDINLETSLFTWKHHYEPGYISIKLEQFL